MVCTAVSGAQGKRAPRKGEEIAVPGYVIECIDVSGSRITRVKVTEEPVANGLAD